MKKSINLYVLKNVLFRNCLGTAEFISVLASRISSTVEIHLQLVSWIYMRLFIWLEIVRNLSNEILIQLAT